MAKKARNIGLGVCQRSCQSISCGVSDFRGADFVFGIEPDGSGGLPVAGFTRPAFRISCLGICIETGAAGERCAIMPGVARVWRDEADPAVQVLAVIPVGEGFHPSLCICFCGKPFGRPVRAVFAGAEQRLREGIVVADPWAAVGRGDAQFLHGGFHRRAFHGAAIVGVQNKRARDAALGQHSPSDQDGRQFRAFALMNFPAHDFPAEDIHYQIEVKEHARDWTRHPGYVPCPDLAGRTGLIAGGRFAPHRRLGPAPVMLLSICAQDAVEAGLRRQIPPFGRPVSARSGLAEGWQIPLNYRLPAQRRIQPRSACLPARGAARGGADRRGSDRLSSSAAECGR